MRMTSVPDDAADSTLRTPSLVFSAGPPPSSPAVWMVMARLSGTKARAASA